MGGPEPSILDDLCLDNVISKYFSEVRFGTSKESWVNFQKEWLLTFSIYAKKRIYSIGFEPETSCASWNLVTSYAVNVFSTHKMRLYKFVCQYIAYFQSLIYFRTELLTRAKFSRHVWTGFCGPTGDGKWSYHRSLSIESSEIQIDFKSIMFRRY